MELLVFTMLEFYVKTLKDLFRDAVSLNLNVEECRRRSYLMTGFFFQLKSANTSEESERRDPLTAEELEEKERLLEEHWICSYQILFTKVCKQSALILPPVHRPYRTLSVSKQSSTQSISSTLDQGSNAPEAYHIGCISDNTKGKD
ncbi:uncharacterized protein LOC108469998 isoform X1 [Gossypium arboreum]|uniref:uncharacterized protein LOC108469998 isoform X1 n=1 Tax=Gossypium arboreum TaxID=29729 RepID=UPI0022F197D4|nr:uncharacterized protein LOC108469998 isoform X1 [Gossypium arboreum]XP_052874246.1 uncharacterized protein LOC108469998 isoform X1 [Gossypium arboreum]